jgi:hypothetical protein
LDFSIFFKGLVEFSTPRLKTFWRYAKVEFKPPISEIPEVTSGVSNLLASAKSGKWKHLTVKVRKLLLDSSIYEFIFVKRLRSFKSILGIRIKSFYRMILSWFS